MLRCSGFAVFLVNLVRVILFGILVIYALVVIIDSSVKGRSGNDYGFSGLAVVIGMLMLGFGVPPLLFGIGQVFMWFRYKVACRDLWNIGVMEQFR